MNTDSNSVLSVPVSEAASDFLRVLREVEACGQEAILLRDGQAVARLVPVEHPAGTGEELAARWEKLTRLPVHEAAAFADDVESARTRLPSPASPWD